MKTMEQARSELIEMYTKENEEIKRKIMEIDAKCQNKKLELDEKIKENIEFMRNISNNMLVGGG